MRAEEAGDDNPCFGMEIVEILTLTACGAVDSYLTGLLAI